MKIKAVFWLFNIIVICAVSLLFLASAFLFPMNVSAMYWNNMKLPIILFFGLIVLLDVYLLQNWKLFTLLEKEDWTTLLSWLENKMFRKGHLRKHYINLFIKIALVLSDYSAIGELEKQIRQHRPNLLYKVGVSLGIPILLNGKRDAIIQYFSPLADNPQTYRRDWAQCCRAFALGLNAKSEFLELLDAQDPAVQLLSSDFLHSISDSLSETERSIVQKTRNYLKSVLPGEKGIRLLEHSRDNHFMAAILDSRINLARDVLLAET